MLAGKEMSEDLVCESYLDQEVDVVQPFEGPAIRFSHIEANNDGLRPYQSEMKQDVYNLWDKIDCPRHSQMVSTKQ